MVMESVVECCPGVLLLYENGGSGSQHLPHRTPPHTVEMS